MALKAILASKAEYDALPEATRKEYVEKDGKYTLDVEGGIATTADVLELKTKLAEFRDNNRVMHSELETLRPMAKKFEGVDPDEYRTLKEEVAALKTKGVSKPDDVQRLIRETLEREITPLKTALAAEKEERAKAQKAADEGKFREMVTAEATKANVSPTAIRHVLREAESVFELKDGADGQKVLSPRTGVKHPTDPLKDLTTTDWLQNLAKTDEYLFAQSTGGGAPGAGANGGGVVGGRPGAKILRNPSAEEIGRNEAGIIKGEVVVVRQ